MPGDDHAGIAAHAGQFVLQLTQVFCVGLTIGMTRVVVPAVAETQYGVHRGDAALLVGFVVAFGLVKAAMNLVAGRLSERLGRKPVLVLGWVAALPIPWMIAYGPSWNWVIAATVLLGVNQGLAWSMTITAKHDMARADQHGAAGGLNEFAGYVAVALAGLATAHLAAAFGPRRALLLFGATVTLAALIVAALFVRETRPERLRDRPGPSFWPVAARVSFADRRLFAACQAGLVEKFADALIWVMPAWLVLRGMSVEQIGWIAAAYGTSWGAMQLITGPLSDRIGRRLPIAAGMLICGLGVAVMPARESIWWWCSWASVAGLGMALLYPTLGAAVAGGSESQWRGTALGVYRFWRDIGYAMGALGLGLAARAGVDFALLFPLVGACLAVSGGLYWLLTRPNRGEAPSAPLEASIANSARS